MTILGAAVTRYRPLSLNSCREEEQQLAVTSSQQHTAWRHETYNEQAATGEMRERVTRMWHLIAVFIVLFVYGKFDKFLALTGAHRVTSH